VRSWISGSCGAIWRSAEWIMTVPTPIAMMALPGVAARARRLRAASRPASAGLALGTAVPAVAGEGLEH
jgi:hypothetical protein